MHGSTSSRWQRANTRCGEAASQPASQQVRQQPAASFVAAAKPGFLFVFCRSGLISAQPLRRIPFEASSAVGSAAGLAVSRGGFWGEGSGTGWIIFVIMRKDAAVRSRITEWDGRRMSECLGWGGWLVSSLGGLPCRQGQHESNVCKGRSITSTVAILVWVSVNRE